MLPETGGYTFGDPTPGGGEAFSPDTPIYGRPPVIIPDVPISVWNDLARARMRQYHVESDEGCDALSLLDTSAAIWPGIPLPDPDSLWPELHSMFASYYLPDARIVDFEQFARYLGEVYPAWNMRLVEYRLNRDGQALFGRDLNRVVGPSQGDEVPYDSLPLTTYDPPFSLYLHQPGGNYGHSMTYDGSPESGMMLAKWMAADYQVVGAFKFGQLE